MLVPQRLQFSPSKDESGEKLCGAQLSAFSSLNKNAPSRASNLKRHLQRFHLKVSKLVVEAIIRNVLVAQLAGVGWFGSLLHSPGSDGVVRIIKMFQTFQ